MTTPSLLDALIPLVDDLAREMPGAERYRRLLEALRVWLPCDAAALLRLEGDWLLPLAVDGLSADTLGRRFRIAEHPRFAALLEAEGPLTPTTDWWKGSKATCRCTTAWAARSASTTAPGAC
jgi:anaerobic nitric oxide reductase transcription regulator